MKQKLTAGLIVIAATAMGFVGDVFSVCDLAPVRVDDGAGGRYHGWRDDGAGGGDTGGCQCF